MSKRPLCGAALLWAVMLWLLGQMQVSAFTFQTPKLPLKIPLEKAAVSGEIYKKEEFTLYTNLYIKNANLTINSKQYSIDNVKVHIKREKCSTAFRCGDKVFVKGRLEEIPLPANLGQFNERVYNYARGIKWYQSGESVQVLKKNFNLFLKWQNKIKEMWIKGISKVVPEDKIGFFESVLLGEKRNLDSSQNYGMLSYFSHFRTAPFYYGRRTFKNFAETFRSLLGSREHFYDCNDFIWRSYRQRSGSHAGGNYVFSLDWSIDLEKNV